MSYSLTSLLLVPFAGLAALLLVPVRLTGVLRSVVNLAALTLFLAAVPLWWKVNVGPGGAPFQLVERHVNIPALGTGYVVGVDGFSALLILLTALAGALAAWSLPQHQGQGGGQKRVYAGLLALQAGLVGLCVALDMVLFFVCWLIVLGASVWLVRAESEGKTLSRRLLRCGGASTVLIGAGLLALYFLQPHTNGASFDVTTFQPLDAAPGGQAWILGTLLLGFMLPPCLFPFLMWRPIVKPVAASALRPSLAAGLLAMALCGLLRFALPFLPLAVRDYAPTIGLLCSIGVVAWAVATVLQKDWNRLLATAVSSQMTMVILSLFALNPVSVSGSLLQGLNTGLCAVAVLLVVAMAANRGRSGVVRLGGLRSGLPLLAVGFLLTVLAFIGLPALNTFIGARLIVRGLWRHDAVWAGSVVLAMALIALRLLSAYRRTVQAADAGGTAPPDLTYREIATLLPVIGIAFWIGVHPEPFMARLTPSVNRVVLRVSPEFAAECDTTLTPEILASSPGAQFLAAAPCGPDGTPLPDATSDAH
jgi:NADH-quinone oxidoreductase subunit M